MLHMCGSNVYFSFHHPNCWHFFFSLLACYVMLRWIHHSKIIWYPRCMKHISSIVELFLIEFCRFFFCCFHLIPWKKVIWIRWFYNSVIRLLRLYFRIFWKIKKMFLFFQLKLYKQIEWIFLVHSSFWNPIYFFISSIRNESWAFHITITQIILRISLMFNMCK